MSTEKTVTLTATECAALHELIDGLNGGNAGDVFAWDGSDDPTHDLESGAAKLFLGAGEEVPATLMGVLDEEPAPPRLAEVPDRPPGHVDAVAEGEPCPVPVGRWPDGEPVLLLRSRTGYAVPILAAEIESAQPARSGRPMGDARVVCAGAVYFVRESAADIQATLDRLKAEDSP